VYIEGIIKKGHRLFVGSMKIIIKSVDTYVILIEVKKITEVFEWLTSLFYSYLQK